MDWIIITLLAIIAAGVWLGVALLWDIANSAGELCKRVRRWGAGRNGWRPD